MRSKTLWAGLAAFALLVFLLTFPNCGPAPGARTAVITEASVDGERTLTAVLFPYIPDSADDNFTSLISTLESWFEAAHPEIDLQITIDPNMNLYDLKPGGTVNTLLGTGSGSANVVELDTVLLGDLVQLGWVDPLPFSIDDLDLFPASVASATVNSQVYGVPTYLCGNYVYSWAEGIENVDTGQGLIDFLSQSPDPSATALVGNFKGSWTLPSLYVDAWADTHTNDPSQVAQAYDLPLDSSTMNIFTPVVDLCGSQGGPCLTGSYKDNTHAETLFAQNEANGFVGYSERLFYILQARDGNVALPSVISAPLGVDSHPVMFVDALMTNPHCTGQCATDAETFSRFMSTLKVRNLIAFSQDAPPLTFPRYLLQALVPFYTTSMGSENLIYRQIYPILQIDLQYPNQGLPQKRPALNEALLATLTGSAELRDVASAVGQDVGGVRIRHAPARFPTIAED